MINRGYQLPGNASNFNASKATDIISNNTSLVGGITMTTGWNKNEKESLEMKDICRNGWDKYMRNKEWLNTYAYERVENVIKSVGKTPLVPTCQVFLPGYATNKGILSSVGVDMLLEIYANENKLTQEKRIVFAVVDHLSVARLVCRKGWKIAHVYRCDDGNDFEGLHSVQLLCGRTTKESLTYITVYRPENENLFNFIKKELYDRSRSVFLLEDYHMEQNI